MKIANDIRFLDLDQELDMVKLCFPLANLVHQLCLEKLILLNRGYNNARKSHYTHNGITMAGSHGHFELNVFKPLIAHNILQSIDLLDMLKTLDYIV